MKSFFKRQSDFVYNIYTLAKGTAFSQILPIIITPFLTRLFTPEEFGITCPICSMTTPIDEETVHNIIVLVDGDD